jgi:hypothetical protein
MANLISIGNIIVNLDQVSVLDLDPKAAFGFKVRIFGNNSSSPIFEVDLEASGKTFISALVDPSRHFGGTDKTD